MQQGHNNACENGNTAETVVESLQSSQAATEEVPSQQELDVDEQERELEREVLAEDDYQHSQTLEAQLREHEALEAEEAAADEERYETLSSRKGPSKLKAGKIGQSFLNSTLPLQSSATPPPKKVVSEGDGPAA